MTKHVCTAEVLRQRQCLGAHCRPGPVHVLGAGTHKFCSSQACVLLDCLRAVSICRQGGVMVCTDAAARGIDIPLVSHVIQADFASSAVDFLHRVCIGNHSMGWLSPFT